MTSRKRLLTPSRLQVANWFVKGVVCNTMTPMNTFMRAPTRLACKTFMEHIIDHVSVLTGKTPEAVRQLNLATIPPPTTLATASGTPSPPPPVVPSGVPEIPKEMFASIMAATDFQKLSSDCDTFNAANLWRKRGAAALPTEYVSAGQRVKPLAHQPVSVLSAELPACVHAGMWLGWRDSPWLGGGRLPRRYNPVLRVRHRAGPRAVPSTGYRPCIRGMLCTVYRLRMGLPRALQ